MKTIGFDIRRNGALVGCFFLWLAGVYQAQSAYYQVGQLVTNFTLYARPAWTNSLGYAEDAPMQLRDFAGKIIFLEFFDPN